MDLHFRIHKTEIADEPQRFDFLRGVDLNDVIRVDETHPSKENDAHYVFLVWVKPERHTQIEAKVRRNIRSDRDWAYRILPDTGEGLIIISTWCIS